MGKPFHFFLLALLLSCCFSCKRYVCPTYYTAFNIEKGGPEKYFNYFVPDTTDAPVALKDSAANNHRLLAFEKGDQPVYDRMFVPRGQDRNGVTKKRKYFLAHLCPDRKQDFMKVVRAKVSFSEIDSAEAVELYAVSDSLFSHDRFKRDQYIYMELFGYEILDSMQAQAEREQARLDTLDESSLPKKEQRRLRRERRKEYRRLKKAAKRGEVDQSEVDAYYEEYIAKDKEERGGIIGFFKRLFGLDKKDSGGEEAEEEADGELTEEAQEGADPPDKKEKKRRKKKRDKEEEEPDDGGG